MSDKLQVNPHREGFAELMYAMMQKAPENDNQLLIDLFTIASIITITSGSTKNLPEGMTIRDAFMSCAENVYDSMAASYVPEGTEEDGIGVPANIREI